MHVKIGRKRYEHVYTSYDRWEDDVDQYSKLNEERMHVDKNSYTSIINCLVEHMLFWALQVDCSDGNVLEIRESVKKLYTELYNDDRSFDFASPFLQLVDEDFQLYRELATINAEKANYDPITDELTFALGNTNMMMVTSLREFHDDLGGELEMHISYGSAKVIAIEGISPFYVYSFLGLGKVKKCRKKRLNELKALNRVYANHKWNLIKIS